MTATVNRCGVHQQAGARVNREKAGITENLFYICRCFLMFGMFQKINDSMQKWVCFLVPADILSCGKYNRFLVNGK
jgi:hypothetical protein